MGTREAIGIGIASNIHQSAVRMVIPNATAASEAIPCECAKCPPRIPRRGASHRIFNFKRIITRREKIWNLLFLSNHQRLSGPHPAKSPTRKVKNIFEPKTIPNRQRSSAPATTAAMHQVCFCPIKLGQLLRKTLIVHIDINGLFYVTLRKLFRSSNIDHNDLRGLLHPLNRLFYRNCSHIGVCQTTNQKKQKPKVQSRHFREITFHTIGESCKYQRPGIPSRPLRKMERVKRFELSTSTLARSRSTTELHPRRLSP